MSGDWRFLVIIGLGCAQFLRSAPLRNQGRCFCGGRIYKPYISLASTLIWEAASVLSQIIIYT